MAEMGLAFTCVSALWLAAFLYRNGFDYVHGAYRETGRGTVSATGIEFTEFLVSRSAPPTRFNWKTAQPVLAT